MEKENLDGRFKDFGDAFLAGFDSAAPANYDQDADCETDSPWCAPWHWEDMKEWFDHSLPAYEMGKAWAEKNFDEIEEVCSQDEEEEDDGAE